MIEYIIFGIGRGVALERQEYKPNSEEIEMALHGNKNTNFADIENYIYSIIISQPD